MKKRNLVSSLLALLLVAAMCGTLTGCGSTGGKESQAPASTAPEGEGDKVGETRPAQEQQEAGGVYTVTTDNFESWDYSFTNINAFGDTAGVGMLNIQSWGNKKLALGDDGTCDGVGCSWTIKLEVDGTDYALYTTAHIVGAGDVYDGEGDFTYKFTGSCEEVDDGYKLAAPDRVEVTLDGGFTRLSDGSDFADYIPSAPVTITSDDADDCEAANSFKNKIVPSYLASTVFGGATFHVDGTEITSVTDIDFPVV